MSGFTRAGPGVWGQGCPVCVADVVGTDGTVSCRSVPTAWLKAAFTLGKEDKIYKPVGCVTYRERSQTHWATESGRSPATAGKGHGPVPTGYGTSPPAAVPSMGDVPL